MRDDFGKESPILEGLAWMGTLTIAITSEGHGGLGVDCSGGWIESTWRERETRR